MKEAKMGTHSVDLYRTYTILVENPTEKRLFGRHRHRIILKSIFKKQVAAACTAFIWVRLRTSGGAGSFKFGNEPPGSTTGEQFLD
jgi:hypothetical protein